jgi:hypothetical protein
VLTFPWNFPEIVGDYERRYRPLEGNNFWNNLLTNSNGKYTFGKLFY